MADLVREVVLLIVQAEAWPLNQLVLLADLVTPVAAVTRLETVELVVVVVLDLLVATVLLLLVVMVVLVVKVQSQVLPCSMRQVVVEALELDLLQELVGQALAETVLQEMVLTQHQTQDQAEVAPTLMVLIPAVLADPASSS
jgi:hypothetical protein